jgi:hypothetical protein
LLRDGLLEEGDHITIIVKPDPDSSSDSETRWFTITDVVDGEKLPAMNCMYRIRPEPRNN